MGRWLACSIHVHRVHLLEPRSSRPAPGRRRRLRRARGHGGALACWPGRRARRRICRRAARLSAFPRSRRRRASRPQVQAHEEGERSACPDDGGEGGRSQVRADAVRRPSGRTTGDGAARRPGVAAYAAFPAFPAFPAFADRAVGVDRQSRDGDRDGNRDAPPHRPRAGQADSRGPARARSIRLARGPATCPWGWAGAGGAHRGTRDLQ